MSIWEYIFGPCKACMARDYHIASLQQELRKKDELIGSIREALEQTILDQHEVLKHLTGMNRVATVQGTHEQVSIPRRSSIQQRIAHAERVSSDPVLMEQRRKEFEARLKEIEKPEIEVTNDAV